MDSYTGLVDPVTGHNIQTIVFGRQSGILGKGGKSDEKPHVQLRILETWTDEQQKSHSEEYAIRFYEKDGIITATRGGNYANEKDLSNQQALAIFAALDTLFTDILQQDLSIPAIDEAEITAEQKKPSWSYQQLEQKLVKIVSGEEIPFTEIPSGTIDFGEIAYSTEMITRRQVQSTDGNEVAKAIGTIDNTLVFSPMIPGTPWGVYIPGTNAFDMQTKQHITGIAGITHNHINRKIPNPEDLTPTRLAKGLYPLMAVGLPDMNEQPGCIIVGIRSAETKVGEGNVQERVQEIIETVEARYGDKLDIIDSVVGTTQHPRNLSTDQVEEINNIEDPIVREIARENHIALFIIPLGETVGHRVDLSRSILDQIPPKTIQPE
jgi:hypothetical protein